MPETRPRNASDQQGQSRARTQPPASQGAGTIPTVDRIKGSMANAARPQSAHGLASSYVFTDTANDTGTADGASVLDFELPDRGLWSCEISGQIAYNTSADADPTKVSWAVNVKDTDGGSQIAADSGTLYVPTGETDGATANFTLIITTGFFRVSLNGGWNGSIPPAVGYLVTLRAFRLGDLPPGVT